MAEFLNKNLKFLRSSNKISQQELADRIGIDRSTVSRIENNEIETTIDNAIKIADIFNISLSDLLGRDLRIPRPQTQTKTVKFGDVEVTLSKNGKITDKDMLELNQFLMQERILDEKNNSE